MVEDVEDAAFGVHVEGAVFAVHEPGFEVALGVEVSHFEEQLDEGAGGAVVGVAAGHGEHDGLLSGGGDEEGEFTSVVQENDLVFFVYFTDVICCGCEKFFQGVNLL